MNVTIGYTYLTQHDFKPKTFRELELAKCQNFSEMIKDFSIILPARKVWLLPLWSQVLYVNADRTYCNFMEPGKPLKTAPRSSAHITQQVPNFCKIWGQKYNKTA